MTQQPSLLGEGGGSNEEKSSQQNEWNFVNMKKKEVSSVEGGKALPKKGNPPNKKQNQKFVPY